jgi:hypothetical protein
MIPLNSILLWSRKNLWRMFLIILAFSLIWQQILITEPVNAAISLRGSATTGTVSTGTSITVNKPTGVVTDDVMIATVVTSGTPAITATGWTLIDSTSNSTVRLSTYYKRATSSEGASYNFTWSGNQNGVGAIIAFQGVKIDDVNPIDGTSDAAHSTNSGSGTTLTANSVTTTTNNAMLVASYGNLTTAGISQPTGMNERFDATSVSVNASGNSEIFATAGATGTRDATGTSANWAAHLVALTPAPSPSLNLAAYRFSINADNTNPLYITDNISSNDDSVNGTAVDNTNGYFYTVGDNGSNWIIEKRRIADGSLCTSTNCGTTFGTAGVITEDVASSTTEKAYAAAVDITDSSLYVVGMDQVTGNTQWRVEKRSMTTGNLDTSFNGTGILQSNPTSVTDEATSITLDTINNYVYVGGYDSTTGNQWRIEKYRMSDGAYCTAANCGTQFGTNGVYVNNVSNGDDRITTILIDPTNEYIFIAGSSENGGGAKKQWTLYKLHATNSNPCSAAECGTQFGTNGVYTSDPDPGRDDQLLTLQIDPADHAIFLGGFEATGNNRTQWRMEKIDIDTAVRSSTFNNGACGGGGNSVCAVFTSSVLDKLYDMDLDGAGGFIYSFGITDEGGTNSSWRIQKRNRANGALVSTWATSGTATINPSSNKDPTTNLVLDVERGLLWAVGGDRTLSTTNMQWYFTQLQLDSGSTWLAAQDTAAPANTNITFRLRLLLHVTTQQLLVSDGNTFKLQYSPKSGTCDTGFVGESYQDIPTSGSNEILYHDNPSVSDATTAVSLTGDPAHSGHTNVVETIEESNTFTNSADVLNGQDGLWDFILRDNGAVGTYCFKVVRGDGTDLAAYTVIPEIDFCKGTANKTENSLRHGTYFCAGFKKSFFWAL